MALARRHPEDPLLFAEAHRRIGGRPLVVPPALHEVYRDPHPFVAVQKPSQVGVTEMSLNLALWVAATMQGGRGNVLYLLPTAEFAERISQQRLAPAIEQSPTLSLMAGVSPATQKVGVRTVGGRPIYIVGSQEQRQFAGIDADLVVLDEFDLMDDDVLPQALARLRSSQLALCRVVSTPTVSGVGIHALLEQSDERHYELQCARCRNWVEPQFPQNVTVDALDPSVVCDCGAPLPFYLPGRWVAIRPEVTSVRGYQLNRLTLPSPPLRQMIQMSRGTVGLRLEEFYRQDLGVPFEARDARLSQYELDKCRAPHPPSGMKPKAVVMGVDVGDKVFWVVVRGFYGNGRSMLLAAERVVSEDWEVLGAYCARFDVDYCLVDALPEGRAARQFVDRLSRGPGRTVGFICRYDRRTDHEYDWGTRTVHAARTLALDELFDSFRRERNLVPEDARGLAGGAYYAHLQALVRVTEPDEFGQAIPAYRHTLPDDFAHAEAYISLAAMHWGRWRGWWE